MSGLEIIDAEIVDNLPATRPRTVGDVPALAGARDNAARIIGHAKSANTRRGYAFDEKQFVTWCKAHGLPSLPHLDNLETSNARQVLNEHAETVLTFLAAEHDRGSKPATIERRAAGIVDYHQRNGWPSPMKNEKIRAFLRGLRTGTDEDGPEPARQVAALTTERLTAIIEATPADTVRGRRDRAVLLTGVHGAFRRSELAGLVVGDYRHQGDDRAVMLLRRSKTDQTAEGNEKSITTFHGSPLCARTALDAWLADIDAGPTTPLFRQVDRYGKPRATGITGRTVANIVKAAAERAGIDPKTVSGHSMRAGFVTIAALNGASVLEIQHQTGHKSGSVVAKYMRAATIHDGNAATSLFDDSDGLNQPTTCAAAAVPHGLSA